MNVPKLRFKEFNGEWEKLQLNSFVDINPKNDSLPEQFIYIDLESVNNGLLTNKKIISKSEAPSRAQRTIKKNDILYQTVRPYQMNNLFINNLDQEFPYIASTGYALLRTNENPYFVYSILYQKSFVNKVLDMCTGTSYPAISANDLGSITVGLPSLKEQEKISRTLELLDKKIELQNKKIEDLKLFKISMLDSFFNSKSKIQKDTLSKFGKCLTGKSKVDKIDINGNKYIMDMGTITSDGNIIKSKPTFCTDDMLSYGDLIIPKDDIGGGLIIGKSGFIDEDNKYILGDHVYLLKTNNINSLYLHYQINSRYINKLLKRKVTGSAQLGIKADNILNQEIFVHDFFEQENIANVMSKIDNKILLENEKFSKLLELKKGLMQNMFV